jgi:Mrp family chromosome partitioning ATPase/uncharacterized protein involved in exopolysaccharide biosynthesis
MAADPSQTGHVKIYRVPTPHEALQHVLRRWWLLLLLSVGSTGLAAVASLRFHPVWQSFALLQLRAPSEAKVGGSEGGATWVDPAEIMRRLKIALTSRPTLDAVITELTPFFTARELKNRDSLLALLEGLSIDRKGNNLYQLTVRAHSPEAAQKVAERLAERALAVHRGEAEQQAIRLEAFARKQVQEASEKITQLENEMVNFLEKHPVMKVKSLESDPNMQEGDRLRTKRRSPLGVSLDRAAQKDPQLKDLLARQQRLKTELHALTESAQSGTSSLQEALRDAKNQLAELRGQGLKDAHPQVKQLLKRIKGLEAKIAAAAPGAKTAGSEYERKVRDELRTVSAEVSKRVRALAGVSKAAPREDTTELEAQWARMRRAHTLATESHAKLEEVAVNASLKKNLGLFEARKVATIVAQPRTPEAPTGVTRRMIVAAAGIVCLIFSLGVVVLLGVLDLRLQRPEHITRATDAFPILAVLADHPLRAEAGTPVRPRPLPGGGDSGVRGKTVPPDKDGSVIQWLRGTDDLDDAIDLLKTLTPPEASPAATAPGLEAVKTALFDRNAPRQLGSPSKALTIAPASRGTLAPVAGRPEPAGPPPPRINVLPSRPPYAPGLFVSVEPESKPAEQMRLLASRLETQVGRTLRVVTVSSWEPQVGKTTVAANLIMVLAESQKRVLAIDACPGNASLTRIFGIEPDENGLCDQLQRWLDLQRGSTAEPWQLVQVAETLTICTSSAVMRPALPLLASEAFTRFVSDLSHFFDVIVIDTEGLEKTSDAVVLQRLVDGYVMVVGRGRSTARSLQSICSRIDPRRILGFVYNEHRG